MLRGPEGQKTTPKSKKWFRYMQISETMDLVNPSEAQDHCTTEQEKLLGFEVGRRLCNKTLFLPVLLAW